MHNHSMGLVKANLKVTKMYKKRAELYAEKIVNTRLQQRGSEWFLFRYYMTELAGHASLCHIASFTVRFTTVLNFFYIP